jgi:hypothetical protein
MGGLIAFLTIAVYPKGFYSIQLTDLAFVSVNRWHGR